MSFKSHNGGRRPPQTPDEEAVIIRLGKYKGTYPPGLHIKLPFGIDRLEKLKTILVHQAEFGFRT